MVGKVERSGETYPNVGPETGLIPGCPTINKPGALTILPISGLVYHKPVQSLEPACERFLQEWSPSESVLRVRGIAIQTEHFDLMLLNPMGKVSIPGFYY